MIKISVADYALNIWYGKLYDYCDRITTLKEPGIYPQLRYLIDRRKIL